MNEYFHALDPTKELIEGGFAGYPRRDVAMYVVSTRRLLTRKTQVNQRRGRMNPMIEAFDAIEAQVHQVIDLNAALRAQCASLQEQLRQAQALYDAREGDQASDQLQQAIVSRDQAIEQLQQAVAFFNLGLDSAPNQKGQKGQRSHTGSTSGVPGGVERRAHNSPMRSIASHTAAAEPHADSRKASGNFRPY